MKPEELNSYHKNPRKMKGKMNDLLESSLVEYGDLSGIVFNQRTKELVGGHQRTRLLKDDSSIEMLEEFSPAKEDGTVGYGFLVRNGQKFALRIVDWDETKHARANVIANKIKGDWDMDILANQFDMEDLKLAGFELEEFGINPFEPIEKDDVLPGIESESKSKLGDLYELGGHRVLCADSTKIEEVQRLMDTNMADILVTDPPYNVSYTGKTKDALTIENDEMSDASFRTFLFEAFNNAFKVMKAGASFYIFHADSEGYNFRGAIHDVGEKVRQCLIWNKNSMVMGRQDYHWKHEPILYGWKDGASHLWNNDRTQTTVLDFVRPTKNIEHPTMKPVEIIVYLIGNSSNKKDIVLDLFLGGGSTLIAAEKTGRVCYGMELDPKYVDVIVQRYVDYTGNENILKNGEPIVWKKSTSK